MKEKNRFKYEWELFKSGMAYFGRMLLNLAVLIAAIILAFLLVRFLVSQLEIDSELTNGMSLFIALALALIFYKVTFPWLRKILLRIITEREVEE